MKKVKEFFMNKKVFGLTISIVILFIGLGVLFFAFADDSKSKLELSLKEMGKDYYENYYYEMSGKNNDERANTVKNYKELGIKISLDNLERYNSSKKEEVEEFINPKTKEKCDTENTMVTIYPRGEFGRKDYDIKINLVCGFDK